MSDSEIEEVKDKKKTIGHQRAVIIISHHGRCNKLPVHYSNLYCIVLELLHKDCLQFDSLVLVYKVHQQLITYF